MSSLGDNAHGFDYPIVAEITGLVVVQAKFLEQPLARNDILVGIGLYFKHRLPLFGYDAHSSVKLHGV